MQQKWKRGTSGATKGERMDTRGNKSGFVDRKDLIPGVIKVELLRVQRNKRIFNGKKLI